MVHFDLRDFILAGILGGARPGMSRPDILRLLGAPDEWSGDTPDASPIWRYGLFEVHFAADLSWLLFTDYLSPFDAGPGRTLDPWFLASSRTLSSVLAHVGPTSRWRISTYLILRIAGGAELDFTGTTDSSLCSSISAVAPGFERHLDPAD